MYDQEPILITWSLHSRVPLTCFLPYIHAGTLGIHTHLCRISTVLFCQGGRLGYLYEANSYYICLFTGRYLTFNIYFIIHFIYVFTCFLHILHTNSGHGLAVDYKYCKIPIYFILYSKISVLSFTVIGTLLQVIDYSLTNV